jgi:hypothetical protein
MDTRRRLSQKFNEGGGRLVTQFVTTDEFFKVMNFQKEGKGDVPQSYVINKTIWDKLSFSSVNDFFNLPYKFVKTRFEYAQAENMGEEEKIKKL